jgi:hypothetical protein
VAGASGLRREAVEAPGTTGDGWRLLVRMNNKIQLTKMMNH